MSPDPHDPQDPPPFYRPEWWRRALVWPLALLLRLWGMTLRLELDPEEWKRARAVPEPVVICFWHNHILLAAFLFRRFRRPYPMAAVASASRDGAWPATLFALFGVRVLRGSSHNRGARAAREMLGVHRGGLDLCLTPDGSRGPRYRLRRGPAFFAGRAGSPVVMLGASFGKAWRLNTWDRFFLPKPFSRVRVRLRVVPGSPAHTREEEEARRASLQAQLRAISEDPEETEGGRAGEGRSTPPGSG
jgi:hypothetical protein